MLKYEFNKKEKSRGLLKILFFKIEGREKSNKWEPMGHGTSRDGPGVSRELVETLSLRRCSDRWGEAHVLCWALSQSRREQQIRAEGKPPLEEPAAGRKMEAESGTKRCQDQPRGRSKKGTDLNQADTGRSINRSLQTARACQTLRKH